jgi:hypothetical protein
MGDRDAPPCRRRRANEQSHAVTLSAHSSSRRRPPRPSSAQSSSRRRPPRMRGSHRLVGVAGMSRRGHVSRLIRRVLHLDESLLVREQLAPDIVRVSRDDDGYRSFCRPSARRTYSGDRTSCMPMHALCTVPRTIAAGIPRARKRTYRRAESKTHGSRREDDDGEVTPNVEYCCTLSQGEEPPNVGQIESELFMDTLSRNWRRRWRRGDHQVTAA